MNDNSEQIDTLMQEYLDYNFRIRQLKEKKANIRSNILIFLKMKDLDSYQSQEGNRVSISKTKRKKLNNEKVADLLGDKYDTCIEEVETETLRVTAKEGGETK